MKKWIWVSVLAFVFVCGCDSLRFVPGERMKQNAWLHNRTASAAAVAARDESASQQLQELTALSELQSRAFVADYGMPDQMPPAESMEQVLSPASRQLAELAAVDATARPDAFDVADSVMEVGIAVAALFGGAYGVRIAKFLKDARAKSQALKEIVAGNELFKNQNAAAVEAFKAAHQGQSQATRQIVTATKGT